jgi:hypothetical protein
MGTKTGDVAADAAALKAKLDALVKDVEEAEEKAVAARRRARAACTLLEEQRRRLSLLASLCRAHLQAPSTSPSSSSYEETVVVGLHL